MLQVPERLPSVMRMAEIPRSPPPTVVQEALRHLAERREERVLEFRRQEMKRLEMASIKERQDKVAARKAKEQPRSSPDLVDYDLFADDGDFTQEDVFHDSNDPVEESNEPVVEEVLPQENPEGEL